jgi:hypothetical protein
MDKATIQNKTKTKKEKKKKRRKEKKKKKKKKRKVATFKINHSFSYCKEWS